MDTFTELPRLADDLTELGDSATAALVREAIDRFSAWKFEAGERLLERALEERRKNEHEPPRSPYFNFAPWRSYDITRTGGFSRSICGHHGGAAHDGAVRAASRRMR
jgi:hypothetical protein